MKWKDSSVSTRSRLVIVSVFATLFVFGCRTSVPTNAGEAITLMTKYSNRGRFDDAITVAQDWLSKHADDPSKNGTIYEQIAINYLMKASKDPSHKDEWIQQSIAYYDRDLSVHQKQNIDTELYTVGRGFESAGDLSTKNRCLYYERAVKAFEEEVPFIQGDNFTEYGHTTPLAPIRQENEKSLQRVKSKATGSGCTREP
jgi:hypothetical protein